MPSTPNAPPTLPRRPLLSSSSPLTARAFPSSSHPATNAPCGAPRGKKANRKKMATVAAVCTRQPWMRTPEQVVESLFRVHTKTHNDQSPPPQPENQRVWASLVKGKAAVVDEMVAAVHRRDPDARLTLVALTDGERALQILVAQKLNVILILDLLHVMEKVWKAACLSPRRHPGCGDIRPPDDAPHPGRQRRTSRQRSPSDRDPAHPVRLPGEAPTQRRCVLPPQPRPHALQRLPGSRLAHCQRLCPPGRWAVVVK
jgi:hypothetical protein